MSKGHDLAVRWDDRTSSLRRIELTGEVPLHGRPKHLALPNGRVAIVGNGNGIKMVLTAATIEGPQKVVLANGKSRPNGWVIRADKRTIRRTNSLKRVPFRGFYAVGQFRYLDYDKMRPITIGSGRKGQKEYIEDTQAGHLGIAFRPHLRGIPGLAHDHPEARLVDDYVSSLGPSVKFGHNYIRADRIFVDLFDLTHWLLIEAKVSVTREAVRMAIGQLRDYRRYYASRRPSLAFLASSRPNTACIKLLIDNHISVIWKTARGRFQVRRWQENER